MTCAGSGMLSCQQTLPKIDSTRVKREKPPLQSKDSVYSKRCPGLSYGNKDKWPRKMPSCETHKNQFLEVKMVADAIGNVEN